MTTRTTALPLVFIAALFTACATTSTSTSTPSSNLSTGIPFVIMDTKVREVRREALDRYVCADGRAITCRCTSKIAWTCDCACSPFGVALSPF